MLDPKHLPPGQEQYESYTTGRRGREVTRIQYDYRAPDGQLFSCVDVSVENCRHRRDLWVQNERRFFETCGI